MKLAFSAMRQRVPKLYQPARRSQGVPHKTRGFTLVEVLVALSIVALALVAGLQASAALTRHAQRQGDMLLAMVCAENALVSVRLARQLPGVGDSTLACEQAGRSLTVALSVRPTPNPNFRRVDARVLDAEVPLWRLTTVVGRY